MKIPNIFVPEKSLEVVTEKLLKEAKPSVRPIYGKLEIIDADSYAKGIAKLKRKGQKPFTFFENVEARIADYENNSKNMKLFKTWLDSVTGVAYKANSTKFKIILRSDKLENIKPDFNQSSIPINYDAENGLELDSSKGKYNQALTRAEAKNHEFWLAVMSNDKEKLTEYVDIIFNKLKPIKKGMGIHLLSYETDDEMWPLILDGDGSITDAVGYYPLGGNVQLLSGAR